MRAWSQGLCGWLRLGVVLERKKGDSRARAPPPAPPSTLPPLPTDAGQRHGARAKGKRLKPNWATRQQAAAALKRGSTARGGGVFLGETRCLCDSI